jgi:hypothetical protein
MDSDEEDVVDVEDLFPEYDPSIKAKRSSTMAAIPGRINNDSLPDFEPRDTPVDKVTVPHWKIRPQDNFGIKLDTSTVANEVEVYELRGEHQDRFYLNGTSDVGLTVLTALTAYGRQLLDSDSSSLKAQHGELRIQVTHVGKVLIPLIQTWQGRYTYFQDFKAPILTQRITESLASWVAGYSNPNQVGVNVQTLRIANLFAEFRMGEKARFQAEYLEQAEKTRFQLCRNEMEALVSAAAASFEVKGQNPSEDIVSATIPLVLATMEELRRFGYDMTGLDFEGDDVDEDTLKRNNLITYHHATKNKDVEDRWLTTVEPRKEQRKVLAKIRKEYKRLEPMLVREAEWWYHGRDEDGQVVTFFTEEISTSNATTAGPTKTVKLRAFHQEIPYNPGFPGFRTRTCVNKIDKKLFEELAKIAHTGNIPARRVPLSAKKK